MTVSEFINKVGFKVDSGSVNQVNQTISGIKRTATKILGTIGIGLSLKSMNALVEEFSQIDRKVATTTKGLKDASEAQELILKTANKCRGAYVDIADYVTKLVGSRTGLFPVEEAAQFVENVTKIGKASGYSDSVIASMNTTLQQVMTSGKFLSQHYNNLLKSSPELIKTICKGLGVTQERLKVLASAGVLTAKQIKDVVLGATGEINNSFSEVPLTISDALRIIRNKWGEWLSQTDKTLEITKTIAKSMVSGFERILSYLTKVRNAFSWLKDKLGGTENAIKAIVIGALGISAAFKIPKLLTGITSLATKLKGLASGASAAGGGLAGIGSSIAKIGSAALKASPYVLAIIAAVLAALLAFQDFITFFKGGDSLIGAFFKKAGIDADDLREKLKGLLSNVGAVLKDLFSIVVKVLGVAASLLTGQMAISLKIITELLTPIIKLLRNLVSKLMPILEKILQVLTNVIGSVFAGALKIVTSLLDAIVPILDLVIALLEPLLDIVFMLIDALLPILDILSPIIDIIMDLVNFALQPIVAIIQVLCSILQAVLVPVLDILKRILTPIIGVMKKQFEIISKVFSIISKLLNAVLKPITEIIKKVASAFSGLGGAFEIVMSILEPFIQIFEWVWGLFDGFFGWISGALESVSDKITGWVSGIGDKIGGFVSNVVDKITGFFGNVANKIKEKIGGITSKLKETISGWGESFKEGAKNIVEGFKKGISDFFSNIGNWIKTHIFDPFVNGFKKLFGINSPSTVMADLGGFLVQGLLNGIKNLWSSITDFFGNALSGIKNMFSNAWSNIVNGAKSAWSNISEGASNLASKVGDALGTAAGKVKDFATNVAEKVSTGIGNAVNGIKEKVGDTVSKAVTAIKDSAVGKAVSGAVQNAKETVSNALNAAKNSTVGKAVSGAIQNAKEKVGNVVNAAKNSTVGKAVTNAVNTIKETPVVKAVSNVAGKVTGAVSSGLKKIGSFFGLANGGYVEANNPMPVIIGDNKNEGEIVSPISKMRQTVLDALTFFGRMDDPSTVSKNISNTSTSNTNVTQNINISNRFEGDRAGQQKSSVAMEKAADDCTAQLARGLAFAK